MIRVVRSKTQKEIMDNVLVRGKVFIVGQNIDWEIEFDGLDGDCVLYTAYYNDVPVGAARLYGNKVGRVATLSSYRKKGIASAIMNFIEKDAIELGIDTLKLNAQLYIADFYEKRGYVKKGDVFLEADIKHIHMIKEIK